MISTLCWSEANPAPCPKLNAWPWCQSTVAARPSAYFLSSQASRDFPSPGSPITDTSCRPEGDSINASKARLTAFMDGFSHFGLGWSWGGFESLIVPAHIRRSVSPFAAEGPVLRIHAGLEDAQDLIADLEKGFERLKDLK